MNKSIQTSFAWNRAYAPTGGTEQMYLLIECKGMAQKEIERAPINVALVLDRSGSMSGSPIQYSKEACKFVVEQMSQNDLLSLVAFDHEVQTVFAPQNITYKDAMKKQIDAIDARGSTNLSGGLVAGAKHVLDHKHEGWVQRVILLSDGHANHGVTDPQDLAQIAKEFNTMGTRITTMGVGEGFDEELMESIADQGGGNFYFIEQPDQIPDLFAKELEGLLSVVGQNLQIKLKPTDYCKITSIYGYQPIEDQGTLLLNIGDIYHHETKSILVELALYPHAKGTHEVLGVEINYVDVTEGVIFVSEHEKIELEFTNDLHLIDESLNPNVEKQIQITQSAKVIEEAMQAFDAGDIERGQMLIRSQADQMNQMANELNDSDLLQESMVLYSQLNDFEYNSMKRKELHREKYRQMKRKKE